MRRPSFEVNFRGRLRRIQVLPFTETRRAWERKRGKQEGDADASRLTEDRRWRSGRPGCTSPAMFDDESQGIEERAYR